MSLVFRRSLRSLEADSQNRSVIAIVVASILLLMWLVWFFVMTVPVYEMSTDARIEVAEAAHSLGAPNAGRLVRIEVEIGRRVEEGQVLVVLDTERETSQVEESDASLDGLESEVQALERVREAEVESWENQRRANLRAVEQVEAQHREAISALRLAESEHKRAVDLAGKGLASEVDLEVSREAAQQQREVVSGLVSAVALKQSETAQHRSLHHARLAEYDRRLAELRADISENQAVAKRHDYALSERIIRAPRSGRLVFVTPKRPGSIIETGERLVELIPDGELIAVCRFSPSSLGRIKKGQTAKMRLDAFPWIQYGQVRACVLRSGSDRSQGEMRVDFKITGIPPEIVLEHGLTGTIAVVVDEVSPALLTLRAAGRFAIPRSD